MSKQEIKDTAAGIVRIETKLDLLIKPLETKIDVINSNITKVVYALLGIVAATVGVQFTPHSPIDWVGGADTGTRFIAIIVSVFMTAMIWKAYKMDSLTETNPKWLCIGLTLMSLAMFIFSVCPTNVSFIIILPVRLSYVIAFGYYGWHVTDVNLKVGETVKKKPCKEKKKKIP